MREGSDITLVSFGKLVGYSLQAAEMLEKDGISCEVGWWLGGLPGLLEARPWPWGRRGGSLCDIKTGVCGWRATLRSVGPGLGHKDNVGDVAMWAWRLQRHPEGAVGCRASLP